jgi:hypothetical protein
MLALRGRVGGSDLLAPRLPWSLAVVPGDSLDATALATAGARTLRIPTGPADRYFDYCLQPYAPRCDPRGKLRGESLLWSSLDVAGVPVRDDRPFHAVQRVAGRDMTVFGVKQQEGGALSWELYFYDPDREDPRVTAANLRRELQGELEIVPEVADSIGYFMVSFELDAAALARRRVDELDIYLPMHEHQGGFSYKFTATGRDFRNTYRFHDPRAELDAIVHQLERSVFVDMARTDLAEVLLPELLDCAKICVARKRLADAIYYSGITVGQLLWFLRRFAYPAAIVDFVEEQRGDLEHLRFDVGIDHCTGADGRLVVPKTSYYSTL